MQCATAIWRPSFFTPRTRTALTHAIDTYPAPPEKLVVGLTLFFFDYTCNVGTAPDAQLCSIKDFYKTHNPDSTSALNPISYAGVLALAAGSLRTANANLFRLAPFPRDADPAKRGATSVHPWRANATAAAR